jgi:hypothetical protein
MRGFVAIAAGLILGTVGVALTRSRLAPRRTKC